MLLIFLLYLDVSLSYIFKVFFMFLKIILVYFFVYRIIFFFMYDFEIIFW